VLGDSCGGPESSTVLKAAASKGRVLISTHRNADPDALAAAVAAASYLRQLGAEPCIALPEGMSRAAKQVLASTGVRVEECGELAGGALLVVDASNSTQLGGLADLLNGIPLYLIDHHAPGDLAVLARESYIAPAVSCTQLVVHGGLHLGLRLSPPEATLALAGIIYDSRRFQIADQCAFRAAAELMGEGGDYNTALAALAQQRDKGSPGDFSERVARLKAAQRLRFSRICREILVVVTYVGAFESSAARALLDLGSDVAVVVGGGPGGLRASIRLSRRALEAGLKASEIAEYIASRFGGRGGGHDAAGMAHLEANAAPEEVAEALARSLPGKVARICVERRGRGGGAGQD
jgi:nanoRNase/pAp phosphatase (c-di-AMP/oligoRNAs hydrolase)